LYVYPVLPTFPVPDDPQYWVPPVLGVTVGQGGSPASPAEASASPAVASAAESPPSLLAAELAPDPEEEKLLLDPLVDGTCRLLDPDGPVLARVLAALDAAPVLDDPLAELPSLGGLPVTELGPQAATHAHERTTGRAHSPRRLRMTTRLTSSERIGVSSESGPRVRQENEADSELCSEAEEFCSWRNLLDS
jgi:hypothetical protein